MFFHQNLMLILIFKIVSPKNVSLKSYNHLSGDQPPMHDLYRRNSINKFSFVPFSNGSKKRNLLLRKNLLLTVSLLQLHIKKLQNMLIKEVKVLHSRNSLNDSGP